MDFPTKPEADRLGRLYHEENYFGQTESATLCDEDNRARFRREGARAVFENARCIWPQGIMAQVHPRVVSVVRNGWDNPRDMGRLGALAAPGSEETGLTDGEVVSLEYWLSKFAPRQVVFCGPVARSIVALVNGAAKSAPFSANGGAPRVIFASGCPLCPKGGASINCGSVANNGGDGESAYACVRGHFSDPGTLRAIRALLGADPHAALVLTGDVEEADVEPLLRAVSPFLGPKGVVLAASGRYERHEIRAESAIGRPLKAWLTSGAPQLGFALYLAGASDRAASRDWIAFWQNPEAVVWSRQWMPIVADIGYDAETPTDGGEGRSDGSPKESKTVMESTADTAVPADP
jgi:hypothetical protein